LQELPYHTTPQTKKENIALAFSSNSTPAQAIEEASQSTTEPRSLAEVGGPQSAGASVTGAVIAGMEEGIVERIGRYRWKICALLFFATSINYIDRQVLGIVVTDEGFKHTIVWSEAQYGYIQTVFQGAYAVGLLLVGNLMDRFGTRKGFSSAVGFWSIAAMCHSLAHSALGFGAARFALGLGEAGNFPAAIKTVAEWFPKRERALATGIFNSGSNVGAIVAPLVVPFIAIKYGWQWAFIITGMLGFIWLAFWLLIYRRPQEHPKLSPAELAHIQSDPAEPTTKIPWAKLFPHRQTWAFAVGKFMTDPIWWVYLFWLPKFLNSNYGLNIIQIGLPLVVIYVSADVGSIGGGWLSSSLIKRGWSVNKARKTAMLICAAAVTPIMFAAHASSLWAAVGFVSLAAAAHQGWSANMFTMASDMFPRRAVGSVVGIGGMAGAIGGMLIATTVGLILQYAHSYLPIFIIAGSTYLVAILVIHLLVPRLEPANIF
jgi:ACS family hexuronate transporter-like MFS transporter